MRVVGDSMSPALEPGDRLAVRALRVGEPQAGQVVVARIGGLEVVKRVASIEADGRVVIRGDQASASTDSRSYGPVMLDAIIGVAGWRYWPRPRRL